MEPSVQSPAAVRLIALPDALALQEDGDLVIPAIRGLLQGCGLEKRYAVFLLSQLRQGIPAGAQRYALFHPWGQEEADPQGFPLHIQEGDPEKECAEERLMYSFPQGQAGVALRGPLESRGEGKIFELVHGEVVGRVCLPDLSPARRRGYLFAAAAVLACGAPFAEVLEALSRLRV